MARREDAARTRSAQATSRVHAERCLQALLPAPQNGRRNVQPRRAYLRDKELHQADSADWKLVGAVDSETPLANSLPIDKASYRSRGGLYRRLVTEYKLRRFFSHWGKGNVI